MLLGVWITIKIWMAMDTVIRIHFVNAVQLAVMIQPCRVTAMTMDKMTIWHIPGQTSYQTSQRGDGSWDYNCDGNPDLQWSGAESCSDNLIGSATGCTSGWVSGEASCGQYKQYSTSCHLDCSGSTIVLVNTTIAVIVLKLY